VPSSGHIAGVYARIDADRGVHKDPAGTEAVIYDCLGLAWDISDTDGDVLYPARINYLKAIPGIGVVLWGCRNLGRDVFINTVARRRFLSYIQKVIKTNFASFVAEGNTPDTWLKIRNSINGWLRSLCNEGRFASRDPEKAFFVKCDEETNPPQKIEQGILTVQIGVALIKAAEFLVFEIGYWSGGIKVTE
jgi:hypothetical protein